MNIVPPACLLQLSHAPDEACFQHLAESLFRQRLTKERMPPMSLGFGEGVALLSHQIHLLPSPEEKKRKTSTSQEEEGEGARVRVAVVHASRLSQRPL